MKLSIIIPVYNVEQYLSACVESVIHQTIKDFEIILVDDGSTDTSGRLCDSFAEQDPRIRVLHKPNGGLMSAWKAGVEIAGGTYVGFVDSDDWVEPDMFFTLLETIERDKSDMVTCGLVKDYSDGRKQTVYNSIPSGVYDRERIIKEIYPVLLRGNRYSRGILINRVTKLFRREILTDILPELSDDVSIGEDLLTTFRFLLTAQKVSILQQYTPYHYRINDQSMIKRYSEGKYEKIELLRKEMLSFDSPDHDFGVQINTDFVRLMLTQMDDEVLFSGKPYGQLRKGIQTRFGCRNFRDIVKQSEVSQLGFKYRLFLRLFQLHWWDAAVVVRMVKK